MLTVLEGHAAPALVAGLARSRDRAAAPQLGARDGVMSGDDARIRSAHGLAAAAGDHLAVGHDRSRRLKGTRPVVEDRRFPRHRARSRFEGVDVVVEARGEDEVAVDGDVPVGAQKDDEVFFEVVGQRATILPVKIAGDGVDGLDDVVWVRHEHDAVVDEGRPLLRAAFREWPRPDEREMVDVVAIDLVERAVAPRVERPSPGQPISRIGVVHHPVGHR